MLCSTEEELCSMVASNFDILTHCGFIKPSSLVNEKDKTKIIQTLALHDVILKNKAELGQFVEGLQSCGVIDALRENPDLGRNFFVISGKKIDSRYMYNLSA